MATKIDTKGYVIYIYRMETIVIEYLVINNELDMAVFGLTYREIPKLVNYLESPAEISEPTLDTFCISSSVQTRFNPAIF